MTDEVKSKVHNRVIHSQGREIISNVYKFMKEEADGKTLNIPLEKARQRTAAATGVSERIVTQINSELKNMKVSDQCVASFTTPNKNRQRRKTVTYLDDFDKCVVRRLVYNFHIEEHRIPTAKLLREALKEKINFQGCEKSLRRILKDLGFTWRKTANNRKLLIEKPEIREKRITYLRALKNYREQGRPIIYLDESYILSSHVSNKTWSDGSNKGLHVPISKGERLIIIHAGGEKGFVPNAFTCWKASNHSGDYHDNVNGEMFMKWMTEKVLPNLEPNSVLVVDNAPYHNVKIEKAPTSRSRKQDMKAWLLKNSIPFGNDMLLPELYKLVQLHKPRYARYALDETVKREGHDILRLPPYHPDLNPIELIWAEIKGYVAKRNTSCTMAKAKALCEEKVSRMGAEDWLMKCKHVEKIEQDYAAAEPQIDNIIESFIISVGNESDTDSSDGLSEEEEELSGIEELQ